jgi:uncharacterized protein
MERTRGPFLTCWPVLTEAAWLLRSFAGVLDKLLSSFGGDHLGLLPLDETDLPGIRALLSNYGGLGIQLANTSLLHLAHRERIETIFTLDHRHFNILRLRHAKRLRIIPLP